MFGSYVHRVLRAQTEANMAAAAIALKTYQIKHGGFPETLEMLLPEFTSEVPVDPFDHKPPGYHLSNPGDFILCSVGSNGVDDGGSSELNGEEITPFEEGWSGRDFVWPQRQGAN